jgi:hypothetical protein
MHPLASHVAVFLIGLAASGLAIAQSSPQNLLELDGVWVSQDRNTVQLPNDSTGTRFSIRDLTEDTRHLAGRVPLYVS